MRILVTAGPTQEYFDTVRFVSNPSSGKMGYALAAEAQRRGHAVVLVSGPVLVVAPGGVEFIRVTSAAEMFEACVDTFPDCEAGIMTAAVCDYRPARKLDHKLRKRARPRHITLVPTQDIAAHLGKIKGHRVLVGFAMEDHDHHSHAEQKLRKKNCDAIVLNGKGNIGTDDATVEILQAESGWSRPQSGTKSRIATTILDLVEKLAESAR